MNNFIQRTLSGAFFVALVIGSILISEFSFALIFSVIAAWAVHEFHKLTNHQHGVQFNSWYGIVGAVILFVSSFLHAADILRYPIFSFYGFYVVLVLISELYRKKKIRFITGLILFWDRFLLRYPSHYSTLLHLSTMTFINP